VLFLVFSDIAYREGSIYHNISNQALFTISLTILLIAVLLMGLVHRERRGLANIGIESITVLVLYLLGIGILAVW
jgi:cation:H+ antiporter